MSLYRPTDYSFSLCSIQSTYYLKTLINEIKDFNKHDIDIFINLAKIVRYGRHWDESGSLYILTAIFPMRNCTPKWCLIDDYKYMSTLNTYCGILSTCHNYKKIIIVDWILCPGNSSQVRSKITQSKQKFYNPLIGL
jgi:hypothetical protein